MNSIEQLQHQLKLSAYLTNKGAILGLSEVSADEIVLKLGRLVNFERFAVWKPRDDVFVAF